MSRGRRFTLLCTLSIVVTSLPALAQNSPKTKLTYKKDISPLIQKNCLPCHLQENENPSGLSIDNYEMLMNGGKHGNTVLPGKPKESNLYLKLLPDPPFGKQMARGRKKLSDEDVQLIYDWIEQGAKKE